ncbi:MAG: hypothetical protein ACNA8W_06780 [Bradymonadaceae bacterium]
MNSNFKKSAVLITAVLMTATLTFGCEVYDAPPEVHLMQHPDGAYSVGEPLLLDFSETIDAETLSVRVWPSSRGTRRVPLQEVDPVADRCNFKVAPCGPIELKVVSSGRRGEVQLNGDLAQHGVPMILEVTEGLADRRGNKTGVSRYFDFQFQAPESENIDPVEFDDGVYILGGTVTKPIPAVLTLITDFVVRPDGTMAMAGARGAILNDAPRDTRNPEDIELDDGDTGWTIYAAGRVNVQEDGSRQLRTDPFEVVLPVVGLEIRMMNMGGTRSRQRLQRQ